MQYLRFDGTFWPVAREMNIDYFFPDEHYNVDGVYNGGFKDVDEFESSLPDPLEVSVAKEECRRGSGNDRSCDCCVAGYCCDNYEQDRSVPSWILEKAWYFDQQKRI